MVCFQQLLPTASLMHWAIYTLSTLPFEVAGLCGSVEECMTLRRSYPNYSSVKLLSQRLAHVLCVCLVLGLA
jgi:hypothetical protein